MRKEKKSTHPAIHMGTSLLLVIFIILCMVIFAVLSLTSAAKDMNYSEKNALRTTAYYTACNQAEHALAEIDSILCDNPDRASAIAQLESLDYIVVSEDADLTKTAMFHVAIDEDEALEVILGLQPEENKQYQIISWKSISTASWTADQTLPVLGSEKK